MVKEGFATIKFTFAQPVVASATGTVTSKFGAMEGLRHGIPHSGIDYACPIGTEIHAPVDGIVSAVKNYGDTNLGKAVFVKMHDGQQYVVGHLSKQSVQVGQEVHTGDLLGLSGNTGNSTGPHLHFGAYDTAHHHIDPGNIPWDAFTTAKETVVQIPPPQPHPIDPNLHASGISGAGNWLGEKISGGAHAIFEPIGTALGDGFHSLFVGTMHALPMVCVIGGIVCYLLTIALAHHKPYFWGLGMWAMSAIIRGINLELGI